MIKDISPIVQDTELLVTEDQKRFMVSLKSSGYVLMNPYDFLDLTTMNAAEKKQIQETASRRYAYDENEVAQLLEVYNNETRFGTVSTPPFLCIECEVKPSRVLGHDGRHRAAACITSSVWQMPVFLIAMYHGLAYSKLPKAINEPYSFRHITGADFPREVVGEFNATMRSLPIDSWVSILQEE